MNEGRIRIVYMGTPEFATHSLRRLANEGYDIPLVITQPDKRGNRNRIIIPPVKLLAMDLGLEVAQPTRIRKDEELIARLQMLRPDLIVVAAFGQILPQSILDIPRYGCINVHGSLLPQLRGASPIQSAILNDYPKTGVTIMRMDAGIDTGDMISKMECPINGMDYNELSDVLADMGGELLIKTLPSIIDGNATYEKQEDNSATHTGIIKKEDGYTDFNEPARDIECKIRAYIEWPTCYTNLDGLMLKLYRAEALMDDAPSGEPGTLAAIEKNSFVVNCKIGRLRVLEVQLQGKKRMSAGDFLRGHKLDINQRFGE